MEGITRRGSQYFYALAVGALLTCASSSALAAPIREGATNGRLDASDSTLNSGEYVDEYQFSVRAGETWVFEMQSSDFDPYLMLRGAGVSRDDDDGGDGLSSRIEHTFDSAGSVSVAATSSFPKEMGSYQLVIRRGNQASGNRPSGNVVSTPSTGGNQTGGSASTRRLTAGQSVSGDLRNGDEQLNSGEFTDRYTFEGEIGQRVRITLQSSAFDAYVMLRGDEVTVDNDDYRSGSLDAQIDTTLPYTGTYTVLATTVHPGETGSYSLVWENVGRPSTSVEPTRLVAGRSSRGTLQAGDLQRQNGQYMDRFQFEGRAGQRVLLDLTSRAFDTFLIVRAPDGSGDENDDISNTDRNSRVTLSLPVDGVYDVYVSSYSRGSTGAYELTLNEDGVRPQTSTRANGELALGRAQAGSLERGDSTLNSGEFYDLYTLPVRAGQTYGVALASSDFDAWVEVLNNGEGLAYNDDETPGSTNAGLTFVAPATGMVQVMVTSYAPGESGAYTVLAREGSGSSVSVLPQGGSGAASNGTGRVFVLSVGISDYGGSASNLQYCAEDAVKLRDAVRSARALAPESIVLTDRQATRANVNNAFRRAAQVVGPDDVFLFFYSGHGGQVRSTDPTEIDGMDETIALVDGQVTDTEFASWVDTVNSRLTIISLDSCHAGGFSRDVITRSNRVGIFSSEEDVLSLVASRFRAGGYLAHFLREALEGGADTDPRDGIVTVGELTQSLRRAWAQNMTGVRTETGSSEGTYQNLVIERAAKVSDIVIGPQQAMR